MGRGTSPGPFRYSTRALVDRWDAELQGQPQEIVETFRYLVAMAGVRHRLLRGVSAPSGMDARSSSC